MLSTTQRHLDLDGCFEGIVVGNPGHRTNDGGIISAQFSDMIEISATKFFDRSVGSFTAGDVFSNTDIPDEAELGHKLEFLGDIDGDGMAEILVSIPKHDYPSTITPETGGLIIVTISSELIYQKF